MTEINHGWNVSYKPPTIGFVISLTMLAAAYRIVTHHHLPPRLLPATIAGIAVASDESNSPRLTLIDLSQAVFTPGSPNGR